MSAIRRLWSEDRYFLVLGIIAVFASIFAYVVVWRSGHLLAYADSLSHLMISRRVISSPTPGFSQLGGVWPPAPHVLILPVVWIDWMYRSGSAGSLLSMASYVGTVLFTYKIARLVGIRAWIAFAATLLMAMNPNMLHMQATSMTELPLLLSITAAIYCLIRWCQSESIFWLVGCIAATVFGTATRYEAWAMLVAIAVVILWVALSRRYSFSQTFDVLLYFGIFSSTFIIGWAAWNRIIIQSGWLGFLDSEYASASIWVEANEPAVGSVWVSLKTYVFAIRHIAGTWLMVLGALGVVAFFVQSRLKVERIGAYALLFPLPFFVLTLALGQRPLHVPEINESGYNVRFALQMLPAIGLFTAFLANTVIDLLAGTSLSAIRARIGAIASSAWAVPRTIVLGVLFAGIGLAMAPSYIVTLDEPIAAAAYQDNQYQIAGWLQEHYPGTGMVLMETPGNEISLFHSRIDLTNVIYEGTNEDDAWTKALSQPGQYADWIVMRTVPDAEDKVAQAMAAHPHALDGYVHVYQSPTYSVYVRAETARDLGLPVID